MDSGTDVRQLLTALAGHLRDLMLLATGAKQAAAQELGADKLALLKSQAGVFAPASLLEMMGELSAAERECRNSNQHRWILERTLVRLMQIGQGVVTAEPQARPAIRPQEKTASPSARPQTQTAAANGKSSPLQHTDDIELPSRANVAASPTNVPRPPTQETAQTLASTASFGANGATQDEDDEDEDEADALETEPEEILAPPPLTITAVPLIQESTPAVSTTATFNASNGAGNGNPASPAPDFSGHQFAEGVTLDVIRRSWDRIVKSVHKISPAGGGFLEKAQVSALQGNTIILSFKEAFARDRIQNKAKELVEKKINEGLKTEGYRIQCLLDGQNGSGGAGVGAKLPTDPPSNGTGMAASMGTGTLLDSPRDYCRADRPDAGDGLRSSDRRAATHFLCAAHHFQQCSQRWRK